MILNHQEDLHRLAWPSLIVILGDNHIANRLTYFDYFELDQIWDNHVLVHVGISSLSPY